MPEDAAAEATAFAPKHVGELARQGVRVEQITIGWMLLEAALSIGAGVVAHSLLLVAFGLDSAIELITAIILLWRLSVQARGASLERVDDAERRSAWVVAFALISLCVYIVVSVGIGLYARARPDTSLVGLAVAAVAAIGMPLLARRKRQLAAQLDSAALRGDAACSMTCAAMAATLFAGLALNALFGWWWAESVAALAFLVWLIPEAREALEGAHARKTACACGDDDCDD
jgi:divalent metal cation (Fe/Co/Zn/Cd) transporter